MLIRSIKVVAASIGFLLLGVSSTGAAEIDAEATREAGTDYASAIRIRISDAHKNPSGKAAQWRGFLEKGDDGDAYKFSPTPVRGQLVLFGVKGEGGPVSARFVDRNSGETLAETQEKNGIGTMVLLVDKKSMIMLIIEHLDDDPDRPYSATVLITKPEEMGVVTPDAATKAFAEAMKRKPIKTPLPEGFSLIVPPKEDEGDSGTALFPAGVSVTMVIGSVVILLVLMAGLWIRARA